MVLSEPFGRIEARTTYGKVPTRKRPALGRRYRPEQDFSSGLRRRDDRRTGTPDPYSAALYGRVLKARGGSANICNSRVVGKPEVILMVPSGLVTTSLSVVSEARVSKLHTLARRVCALSIQRLEGRRWRLRQTRANGYGNSTFSPICKLLGLRYLENEHVQEPQFDTLRWGMTCGA